MYLASTSKITCLHLPWDMSHYAEGGERPQGIERRSARLKRQGNHTGASFESWPFCSWKTVCLATTGDVQEGRVVVTHCLGQVSEGFGGFTYWNSIVCSLALCYHMAQRTSRYEFNICWWSFLGRRKINDEITIQCIGTVISFGRCSSSRSRI